MDSFRQPFIVPSPNSFHRSGRKKFMNITHRTTRLSAPPFQTEIQASFKKSPKDTSSLARTGQALKNGSSSAHVSSVTKILPKVSSCSVSHTSNRRSLRPSIPPTERNAFQTVQSTRPTNTKPSRASTVVKERRTPGGLKFGLTCSKLNKAIPSTSTNAIVMQKVSGGKAKVESMSKPLLSGKSSFDSNTITSRSRADVTNRINREASGVSRHTVQRMAAAQANKYEAVQWTSVTTNDKGLVVLSQVKSPSGYMEVRHNGVDKDQVTIDDVFSAIETRGFMSFDIDTIQRGRNRLEESPGSDMSQDIMKALTDTPCPMKPVEDKFSLEFKTGSPTGGSDGMIDPTIYDAKLLNDENEGDTTGTQVNVHVDTAVTMSCDLSFSVIDIPCHMDALNLVAEIHGQILHHRRLLLTEHLVAASSNQDSFRPVGEATLLAGVVDTHSTTLPVSSCVPLDSPKPSTMSSSKSQASPASSVTGVSDTLKVVALSHASDLEATSRGVRAFGCDTTNVLRRSRGLNPLQVSDSLKKSRRKENEVRTNITDESHKRNTAVTADTRENLTGIKARTAVLFTSAAVNSTSQRYSSTPVWVKKFNLPELFETNKVSKDPLVQREVETLRTMKRVGNGSAFIVKTRAFGGDGPSNGDIGDATIH